jgi:hypothetical protein
VAGVTDEQFEDTRRGELIWRDFTGGSWILYRVDETRKTPGWVRPGSFSSFTMNRTSAELLKTVLAAVARDLNEEIERQGVDLHARLLCEERHPYDGGKPRCDRAADHDGKHLWELT